MGTVTINQKAYQRIRAGHPWVFRSDVVGATGAQPGDVVGLQSQKGQFLGQAFYNPLSQITIRLISRGKESIDRAFLKKRVQEAIDRRKDYLKDRDAVRLIYGESDFLPSVILDQYGDVLVFQTLSAGADRFRDDLISIFEERLSPTAIVERNDPPVRELEGLVRQKGIVRGGLPSEIWTRQGATSLWVDPLDGQKTGLFLDQAENHLAAARYARGRVLDLFSYQGGFAVSVAAAAEEVVAVDSSAPALSVLKENARRNGIENITAVEANGFDFLRQCQENGERFDTVILDPPPFVRDRKSLGGALRGYKELNLRAMKALPKDGVLITCSCSQNFTPELFEQTLHEAARDTHRDIQILEKRGAAPDHPRLLSFPESDYLQCWIVRVI